MTPDRGRTFPRGLVLGLTMAETAILIIFVLLLALTALLGREADRRRDAEQGLEQAKQDLEQYEELRLLLVERGHDPDEFLDTVRTDREERDYADNWRELVRDLDPQMPDPSPETIVTRLQEAHDALDRNAVHEALDDALDDAGIESTPETMTQLAEVVQAGREAGLAIDEMRDAITAYGAIDDALRGRGEEPAPHSLEEIVRDAERWREHAGADSEDLAAELDRANERIERLQAQVQGGGGTDHPSCWYDDDGTIAYLFDVALSDEGYVIQPAQAPQHERKRASLPLSRVRTGRRLDPGQFLDQTQEIYDWSVGMECRFFVRAFDLTASDQKEPYKERMRILESRFYKNANPSGPPPSEDPPAPREIAERR